MCPSAVIYASSKASLRCFVESLLSWAFRFSRRVHTLDEGAPKITAWNGGGAWGQKKKAVRFCPAQAVSSCCGHFDMRVLVERFIQVLAVWYACKCTAVCVFMRLARRRIYAYSSTSFLCGEEKLLSRQRFLLLNLVLPTRNGHKLVLYWCTASDVQPKQQSSFPQVLARVMHMYLGWVSIVRQ